MLLLKHPTATATPRELELEVAHSAACAFPVVRGQLLTIIDVGGCRPVAFYAFTKTDLHEFLSPHHTRVFSNTYVLGFGMRLVTNRRRPAFVLGRDTVRNHDLLMPASTTRSLAEVGLVDCAGCVEAVQAALKESGLAPPKIPDPVNLFAHVEIHTDGRLTPKSAPSRAGDYVAFRVLIDSTCIVSNCFTGLFDNESQTPVHVRVHNEL